MKRLLTIAAVALLTLGAGSIARAQQPDPGQFVANWFQQLLGRPVDPASLNAWVGVLNSAGPVETVAGLLASDDYWILNGSTPQGMVLGMYRDVLGLSQFQVPPQNVDSWVNRMAQSGNRLVMAREFLNNAHVNLYALGAGEAAPPAPVYTSPTYIPPTYSPPGYTPAPTYNVPAYPPRGHAWGWWRHVRHEYRP